MKYFFVFDLDGTLLNDDKEMAPEVKTMFDRLKHKGHETFVATGRALEITQPYLDFLGIKDRCILNNGAVIHDLAAGKNLFEAGISDADIQATIAYLNEVNVAYSVSTSNALYTTEDYELGYYDRFMKMFPKYPLINHQGATLEDIKGKTVYKILVQFKNDEALKTHKAALKNRIQATVTQSMEKYLSILPQGITKGGTLKKYLDEQSVPLDRLVVFGDNDNDAEMLALTHHSYAMINGSESAKAAAAHVTRLDNNHLGVIDMVARYEDK